MGVVDRADNQSAVVLDFHVGCAVSSCMDATSRCRLSSSNQAKGEEAKGYEGDQVHFHGDLLSLSVPIPLNVELAPHRARTDCSSQLAEWDIWLNGYLAEWDIWWNAPEPTIDANCSCEFGCSSCEVGAKRILDSEKTHSGLGRSHRRKRSRDEANRRLDSFP